MLLIDNNPEYITDKIRYHVWHRVVPAITLPFALDTEAVQMLLDPVTWGVPIFPTSLDPQLWEALQ